MEMLDLFSINIKYLEYDFKFNKSIVRKARSPEPWFFKKMKLKNTVTEWSSLVRAIGNKSKGFSWQLSTINGMSASKISYKFR